MNNRKRRGGVIQLAVAALLAVAFPWASWAGEFNAFGPENFVRDKGKPFLEVHTFTILNPNTQYTLWIDNGGANGELKKVSSATVWLNGVQIVGPNRFNQTVSEIVLPVMLSTQNQLVVELRSKPGSGFTLRVIGVDNDPPTITASMSPAANQAGWHNVDANVSFACSDATSGIASCTGPILVDTEGANQVVTGTAVDRAGNSASVSVTLNVDKTPPLLSDFLPSEGDTLPEPEVNLTGAVADPLSGAEMTTCEANNTTEEAFVNTEQPVGNRFVFACSLPLVPGPNFITVQAADIAGNANSSFLTIHHVLPPNVAIDSPADREFFLLSPITVTGTVDDPGATVTVNDIPASVANGVFTASVPMPSGFHTITAVAQNVAGSGSDSVRVFVVLSSAPTLRILSPSDQFVLGTAVTRLDGTVNTPPLPVTVQGWVRDNRLFPAGQPEVTVRFNNSPVTATVSQEPSGACLSSSRCWKFSATQEFLPPTGVFLSIEVEAQTGGGTASRQRSGIVDFCVTCTGDGCVEKGACGSSLFQQGCRQSRRCIANADGCSNPIQFLANNPTLGIFGKTSTAFGQPEDPNSPEGAPTVFGQRRPIQLPCNRHDECFHQRCPQVQSRLGVVADKGLCNLRFFNDMKAVCGRAYPELVCPAGRIGLLNCPQWRREKTRCYAWARWYFIAVQDFTAFYLLLPAYDSWPYSNDQTPSPRLTPCENCPVIP